MRRNKFEVGQGKLGLMLEKISHGKDINKNRMY